ncbi:hypothetical protein FK531_05290 [Rhodococcus spelaei]|uniref:Uncharacterized protein n=1 Tax=Rhodococcus spelaei TaxID=2546320 RepID=A0A541BP51_9NOCA|nr:hypothetical protein [Rhodococcus spelaei]TQF74070.1 hypothetical protein FK531_05290 [Rhodococcus spelaei]
MNYSRGTAVLAAIVGAGSLALAPSASAATRVNEPGRYVAEFTFDAPGGSPAATTLTFDALPSPLGSSS